MKNIRKFLLVLLFSGSLQACALSTGQRDKHQSLIFIHGANMTAASWKPLRQKLPGIKSLAINLPGRGDQIPFSQITLESSAQALCDFIEEVKGIKILIAHSQGGAVVNQAMSLCNFEDINSIIYIAAVIPFPGEKPFELLSKKDEEYYFSGIEYLGNSSELKIKDTKAFLNSFSQDANEEQKSAILESVVSEPSPIGDGVLNYDLNTLKSINKYFIKTSQDRIISLKSQNKITKRLEFKKVYTLISGHLPMMTKVNQLSNIIFRIINQQEKLK